MKRTNSGTAKQRATAAKRLREVRKWTAVARKTHQTQVLPGVEGACEVWSRAMNKASKALEALDRAGVESAAQAGGVLLGREARRNYGSLSQNWCPGDFRR